jgi:hypothetical protein
MSTPNATRKTNPKNHTEITMSTTNAASTTALFDVEQIEIPLEQSLQSLPLDELKLAPNPRKDISEEGIDRLARMLATTGQLMPVIAYTEDDATFICDGQRRYLAAKRSHTVLEDGEPGNPVTHLHVVVLDRKPTNAELLRLQAQANQHETLTLPDQRQQFADCWAERAGLDEATRMRAVCSDLGISPKLARNLQRQSELPAELAARVAARPTGDELSVTLANELHPIALKAPELAAAVADQVVDGFSQDEVRRDMVGAVHKAVATADKKDLFARKITLGQILVAQSLLEETAPHLVKPEHQRTAAALLRKVLTPEQIGTRRKDDALIAEGLKELGSRLSGTGAQIEITQDLMDLAVRNGSTISVASGERTATYLVDPEMAISLVIEAATTDLKQLTEASMFQSAGGADQEMLEAAQREADRRKDARDAQQRGRGRNHDLGSQLRDNVTWDTLGASRRRAAARLMVGALLQTYGDLAVYGAAWTDPAFEQPTAGGMGKEPMEPHVIVDRLTDRVMKHADPMDGIADLLGVIAAGALLDPDGVPRGKALGRDRMERRIARQLPADGGEDAKTLQGRVRRDVWSIAEPVLQPVLRDMHQDTFAPEVNGEDFRPQDQPTELTAADIDWSGVDLGDEEEDDDVLGLGAGFSA